MASAQSLTTLLRDVSRSFHLTLRAMPSAVRWQIGLAYLLARATDTIADTDLLPVERRLEALDQLRARILGERRDPVRFQDLAAAQPSAPGGGLPAERVLLERIEEAVAALRTFSTEDQTLIRQVLDTITGGQELDLRRFAVSADPASGIRHPASDVPIRALETPIELDDYTWRVAGCVGGFWTKICRAHLFPDHRFADFERFMADGIRYGKGLQLVNILRDLPRDLRQGRCYIPRASLAEHGLQPEDLLSPGNEARFRPLYDALLDEAEAHLVAGWAYTRDLPSGQRRVRLACAWPILIGVRTLALLRRGRVLDSSVRIKASRNEVRAIVLGSFPRLLFRKALERQFDRWRR